MSDPSAPPPTAELAPAPAPVSKNPAADEAETPALRRSTLRFPVIGIGASAGGLEALLRFFEQLPPNPGMAFAVVLHLSPDHESTADEILQRATAMPVTQVVETTAIAIDHVYVIPPRVDLTMDDSQLIPHRREKPHRPQVAIDTFFRTLAVVHEARAVCIVLSGTGSDGAVGLARVKELGGITLAQAPDDAAHEGMPRAAIATGAVDIVLPVADMGQCLLDWWQNAQHIRLPGAADAQALLDVDSQSEASAAKDAPAAPETVQALDAKEGKEAKEAPTTALAAHDAGANEQALHDVMGLLRSYTRHDFRHYKRATVLRRIERRLQVNRLPDLPAYREFLRAHPEEGVPLLQDMLISVTQFFRDRESFEALERDALPPLFEGKQPGEQVRAWVAGCATGEEAYSLAMLLADERDAQHKLLELQVFATDIDEQAIAIARRGLYPEGVAQDVAPERLRRFFNRDAHQFRMASAAREPVLFAVHNLLHDPPFSRLDVVCCRNLLIYLDRAAQRHVLEMFRIALNPGGLLFLGSSESADAAGDAFIALDKKHRIYRLNPARAPARAMPTIGDGLSGALRHLPGALVAGASGGRAERPGYAALHQQAIEQFAPPSVLIDESHTVLHLSQGAGRFLERGGGEPSNNLLANVRADVRLELRTALFKAQRDHRSVDTRVALHPHDGHRVFLAITVRPLPHERGEPRLTLVVFDEVEESIHPGAEGEPADAARAQLVGQLEEEIRQLKVHLQETAESSETSTEELKASNEELQAINEELRSATEELETSREELQSMNEELVTVNYELKLKVEERQHINDDLQNLITSSEVATLFVDRGLRVKRYTPIASRLFNLIESDLGRPLLDMTSRLAYPQLADDTMRMFDDLRPVERHVAASDGRHFVARVIPYRSAEDRIEGAILNFFDITKLQAAEAQVRAGEEQLRVAAASTRDFAIIIADEQGAITAWNVGAARIFGYSEEEMLGRPFAHIFTPEDQAHGAPERELKTALETGRADDDRWHKRKNGSRFFASGVTTVFEDTNGRAFSKIARDMTGTKQQELAQEHQLFKQKKANLTAQMANELKDRFLAVMSHELKQPLNLIQMNAELLVRLPASVGPERVQRIGGTIKQAVASQSRIINDLLDLSRMRTGKLRLDREPVDLKERIEAIADAAVRNAEGKTLALELDCDAGLVCNGDRVRIEQIVWNLLSNAVKFTPDGGRIHVGLHQDTDAGAGAGFARITVKDTGCGIAPEHLQQVFGMFNQVEEGGAAPYGGLGIGLALVQELARAHDGRSEVASEGVGKGATFSVWLPLQGAPGSAAPVVSPAEMSFKHWRVLAVDDYVDGLQPFAEVLRLEGATVDIAQSADAALTLLAEHHYDLLVSDLGMPDMDGYAFIAEVRRRPGTRHLQAVAMSGFGRRADARRALEAGFDAHVPKPATVEDLKAAIAGG